MIPVVLIPLLVQLGSKIIDVAFNKLDKEPNKVKKQKALDKIRLNDVKTEAKRLKNAPED